MIKQWYVPTVLDGDKPLNSTVTGEMPTDIGGVAIDSDKELLNLLFYWLLSVKMCKINNFKLY